MKKSDLKPKSESIESKHLTTALETFLSKKTCFYMTI